MQYAVIHKIHAYIHKNESKHSEMGAVRQNPNQRTVSLFMCVQCALHCAKWLHTILHRTDLIIFPLRWSPLAQGAKTFTWDLFSAYIYAYKILFGSINVCRSYSRKSDFDQIHTLSCICITADKKEKKYTKKPKHVTSDVFAETTHVVAAPHGFACVVLLAT